MPLGKVGSPQDTLTEVVVSSLKWMKLGALGAAGMQRSEVNRRMGKHQLSEFSYRQMCAEVVWEDMQTNHLHKIYKNHH